MKLSRNFQLRTKTGEVDLPVYFPSISSVKTSFSPVEYVTVLNALSPINKQYLISAFDLIRTDDKQKSKLADELKQARSNGVLVLMDSGNYESYWHAPSITWTQDEFHSALRNFPCDIAFGFDEQAPPADINQHIKILDDRYLRDREAAGDALLVPIIHGDKISLPIITAQFAQIHNLQMLAVPERCLGSGIFERAKTVGLIRKELNKLGHYVTLHLLGTGNPLSLAIYTISGADSFDGLEWCQTAVDHETSLLHHFSHGDFFSKQTHWGEEEWPFPMRTLAHNIEFYSSWMARMDDAFQNGTHMEFCRANFPKNIYLECVSAFSWETK